MAVMVDGDRVIMTNLCDQHQGMTCILPSDSNSVVLTEALYGGMCLG